MTTQSAPSPITPKPTLTRLNTASSVTRQSNGAPPVPARHSKTQSLFNTQQYTVTHTQPKRSNTFSYTQPIHHTQYSNTHNNDNPYVTARETYNNTPAHYSIDSHNNTSNDIYNSTISQYNDFSHVNKSSSTYNNTELLKTYRQSIERRDSPFVSYNEDYNELCRTEYQLKTIDISQYNANQHVTLLIELARYVRQLALNDDDCVSGTSELAIRLAELITVLNEHKQTLTTYICDNNPTSEPVRIIIRQIRQSLTGGRVILNNALESYKVLRSYQYKGQLRILLNDVIAHTSKLLHTISITLLKHNKLDSAKPSLKLRPGQEHCLHADKYFYGHTVSINYKLAYEFYEQSAKLLYSPAMYNIACMLLNGAKYNVIPDTNKAIYYLKQAVTLNNIDAMNMLAQQYETGNGVSRNLELAIDLYHKAANTGHIDAICNLAYLYEHGSSDDTAFIAVDLEAATAWYTVAADKYNSSKAQNNLAALYYSGKLSQNNIPDYDTAFHWFILAAQQGNVSAQYNLATMYERGTGCIRDLEQAIVYYTLSAKQKHIQAATALGYLLFKSQQYAQSYQWLRHASEDQDSMAMFYIAQMYHYGYYVEQSNVIAYQYYHTAASFNNLYAVYELANCLYHGIGCIADQSYALELYTKCAQSGNSNAMYVIAQCYRTGNVYEQSTTDAIEWYLMAVEHGNGDAAFELSEAYNDTNNAGYNKELADQYMHQAMTLGSSKARTIIDNARPKSAINRPIASILISQNKLSPAIHKNVVA